jgi:hypothetical protein
MSKAVAATLANFNRDNKALPIAPVPTKPIFSILALPKLDVPVSAQSESTLSVISFPLLMQGCKVDRAVLTAQSAGIGCHQC